VKVNPSLAYKENLIGMIALLVKVLICFGFQGLQKGYDIGHKSTVFILEEWESPDGTIVDLHSNLIP
jgi:hypothetical protein